MSLEEDCRASFCWGLSPLPLVVLMGTASQGTLDAWSAWISPITAKGRESLSVCGGGGGVVSRGGAVISCEMGDPELWCPQLRPLLLPICRHSALNQFT